MEDEPGVASACLAKPISSGASRKGECLEAVAFMAGDGTRTRNIQLKNLLLHFPKRTAFPDAQHSARCCPSFWESQRSQARPSLHATATITAKASSTLRSSSSMSHSSITDSTMIGTLSGMNSATCWNALIDENESRSCLLLVLTSLSAFAILTIHK